MAVEFLLFDLGGVIFHYDQARRLSALGQATGLDEKEVQARLWDSGFDHACDAGRYELAGAHSEFCRLLGAQIGLEAAADLMASAFTPWPAVIEMARATICPRGMLTNNGPLIELGLRRAQPSLLAEFDAAPFFSHRLGAAKPDPAIYQAVEARLGLTGAAIGFIDDNHANVAAARARGWKAVQFTGDRALHLPE